MVSFLCLFQTWITLFPRSRALEMNELLPRSLQLVNLHLTGMKCQNQFRYLFSWFFFSLWAKFIATVDGQSCTYSSLEFHLHLQQNLNVTQPCACSLPGISVTRFYFSLWILHLLSDVCLKPCWEKIVSLKWGSVYFYCGVCYSFLLQIQNTSVNETTLEW